LWGCKENGRTKVEGVLAFQEGSFGYDLQFLQKFDSVIILKEREGNAQIIVSAKYQGKVFTSTSEGNKGASFGWIKRLLRRMTRI
jgi:hypothetical protein